LIANYPGFDNEFSMNSSYQNMKVYFLPMTEVKFRVKTTKNYTDNDTLYINDYNRSKFVNPSRYNDQIISTISSISGSSYTFMCGVGYTKFKAVWTNYTNSAYANKNAYYYTHPACGEERIIDLVISD
jgi:hypothetical protein